jgi:hypothetical protein
LRIKEQETRLTLHEHDDDTIWLPALKLSVWYPSHDISNNVDNTGVFKVFGAATGGACHLVQFLLLCMLKKQLRDLAIKLFDISVPILDLSFKAY